MSHFSTRPLTSDEYDLVAALANLSISGTNQGIAKTGATSLSNITFGSGTGGVISVNGLTGAVALTGTANQITISAANVFALASTITGLTSLTSTTFVGALTGNASTATALATGHTIAITGDLTYTSPSFDGSGNVTAAGTLATVNSNVGTFGSATQSTQITVNGKGLITAIANVTVTPAVGSITGLGTGVATFLATPSSANLISAVTDETGSGALVFGTTPTLATPVINGLATGTGVSASATASTIATRDANANMTNNNELLGYTTTATAAGTTTLTVGSTYQQYFTGSTTQTVKLPVASTLVLGQMFYIVNNSTGVVTVQSSGLNTIQAMVAGSELWVTCILTSGTGTASWAAQYVPAATNANTASTLVLRDASGNFSAGTITANLTGTASNVTTNANLTGPITSVGNATSIASQTGTGTKFVVDTSPTIITPTFTTNFTSPIWKPASDSTTAISINKSNGTTNVVTVDTTNSRLGVGTTSPTGPLDVGGWTGIPADINGASANVSGDLFVGNTGATTGRFRQASNGNQGFISWNSYFNVSAALVQMDTTKAAWIVNMVGGGGDYTSIERQPPGGGAFVPIAYFASTGNVKLGGAVRGTTEGTNHLDMFNGTAPAGTLANGFSIYSASGQMQVMDSSGNVFGLSGSKVGTYNNIATVSNGVPSELATIDSTGLTANVAATTIYAVPASGAGMYRLCSLVVETTAGSISSTLPNVQILYTDNQTGGVITIDATPVLGVAGIGQTGALTANTVGTTSTGVIVINAKASTNIQYQTVNYASNLAGMAYALHVLLEKL